MTLVTTQPRLTLLSFGGGQDSTDIAYSLCEDRAFRKEYAPHDVCAIMSDTGNEHPLTYAHVAHMADYLGRHNIPFYFVTPDMGFHTPAWQSLTHQFEKNNTIGIVGVTRSCTVNLKIGPIYKCLEWHIKNTYGYQGRDKRALRAFCRDHGRVRVLIGISRGEETRAKGLRENDEEWKQLCLEIRYPLIEIGRDRQDCQDHIRSFGYYVPPPSNCMMCHFMTPMELLWLWRNHRDVYDKWVLLEIAKMARPEYHDGTLDKKGNLLRNATVFGSKTLPEVLEAAQRKFGHMSNEEINDYKQSHGHCVKSAY